MQAIVEHAVANPLAELISDDIYQVLEEHDLLNDKAIRDYKIRMKFRTMRNRNMPAYDAIERLRVEYPYLQFDTIRKIVYKLSTRD